MDRSLTVSEGCAEWNGKGNEAGREDEEGDYLVPHSDRGGGIKHNGWLKFRPMV